MRWILLISVVLTCGQAKADTLPNSMIDAGGQLIKPNTQAVTKPLKGHVVCRNEGAYTAYSGGYNPVVRRCYLVP